LGKVKEQNANFKNQDSQKPKNKTLETKRYNE